MNSALMPASMMPAPMPITRNPTRNVGPVPRGGDQQQAHGDRARARRQQQAARQPSGEDAHGHGARHVHDGIDEVGEAHARVRLVERSLDLADERRDEEDGPAQQEERREAGQDDVRGRAGGARGGVAAAEGWVTGLRDGKGGAVGSAWRVAGGGRYWTRTSDLTDVNRAL